MLRVALTGGIATGKTYVVGKIREAGIPVIEADVLSREVVAPGTPGLAAVKARFGSQAIRPDGNMDRVRIGHLVFRDQRARKDLEGIIHPRVQAAVEDFFRKLPVRTRMAVADIPLLFETAREKQFDRVVVVACPRAMQVERIMARDRLSREDAERRIAAQMPIEDKIARGDHVIRTEGSFEETDAAVAKVLAALKIARGTATDARR